MKPTSTFLPTEVQLPAATKPVPTASQFPTSTKAEYEYVDESIKIIEASDPASPTYDPKSAAYAEFPEALKQLAALNASTNNAASMLVYAMGFPRQDSILAAQAIISLGPDEATTLLPPLIGYLTDQRPEIRMYSAIILSTTGNKGSCSLGNIGPLLWDADPYVRTSAALAIQGITGNGLVAEAYAITPDHLSPNTVAADTPEGKIVGAARTWWTEQGSKVNWHPSYDLCDP
jgi:HEAT repeat protein